MAQYRLKDYEQAVQTLTLSDALNSKQLGQSADIAFLAMAHHQLGHHDEARKQLARLRQLLEDERWKDDDRSQSFLRQAENLIAPGVEEP